MNIKDIKKCNTVEDLQKLEIGHLTYDIGYRGGKLGFDGDDVAEKLGFNSNLLPGKIGAYVNYLGGGIRGALCTSGYSPNIPDKKKKVLDELIAACERAYQAAEDEMNLNAEEDGDGETNWDAVATNATRRAGVKSYPGL